MKKLMTLTVLLALASCGKEEIGKINSPSLSQANRVEKQGPFFVQPKIGIERAVTIDESLGGVFENLTINPAKEGKVLGDRAFLISANSNVYPKYTSYELQFYTESKLKMIKVFNNSNPERLSSLTTDNLQLLRAEDVNEFYQGELTWGLKNLDHAEMNMMNNGYLMTIETQEAAANKEFKALSTYVVWFQCEGKVTPIYDVAYSCEKYGLKFHYKLLDYKLTETAL